MVSPRRISLLGATGSIGASTLDLLAAHPGRFAVEAVSAHRDVGGLARAARATRARIAVIADEDGLVPLREALAGSGIEAAAGRRALVEAASRPVDLVLAAIVGAAGLESGLAALASARVLALANKECLVCAGDLFMREAARHGATILPVDSEHNAVFQVLGAPDSVERVVLTASGGPFRDWPVARMRAARPADALRHPKWRMGAKISVDSASLMNKGLELIEAQHLFALAPARLGVLVHPQSVVHGLVHYRDGSVLAQLAAPDMRTPIAHCLAWPDRMDAPVPRLDLAQIASLTFENPDISRFPALGVAMAAMRAGGPAPTLLNAANEVAVEAFLAEAIGFCDIAALVESVLEKAMGSVDARTPSCIDEALRIDAFGRTMAREALTRFGERRASATSA